MTRREIMKRKILITILILIILASSGFSFIYWQKYFKTVPEGESTITKPEIPTSVPKTVEEVIGVGGGYYGRGH